MIRQTVLFASLLILAPVVTEAASKPNVLIILADDFGWADASCNWPKSPLSTPAIDRIAKEGIRFTNAHAPASNCTPTRYGLLTGRYPWRSYLKKRVLSGYAPALIREGRETIPSFLKSQGYRTGGFGKWHLGMDWVPVKGDPTNWRSHWQSRDAAVVARVGKGIDHAKPFGNAPTDIGFDTYFGTPSNASRLPFFFQDNRVVGQLQLNKAGLLKDPACGPGVVDDLYVEKAISFIKNRGKKDGDKPFFVYLPLNAAHGAAGLPKRFAGKSKLGTREDRVLWTNESVGKMLAALDRMKLSKKTLVIFTSDNGPVNSPKAVKKGHVGAGPYRGFKTNIWDGGTRVPFLVRWPGRVAPGTTSDHLLGLTDVFATLAAVCDAPVPDGAAPDSVNQLPAIIQKAEHTAARSSLVTMATFGYQAVRMGKWKGCFGTAWSGGVEDSKHYGGARPQGFPADDPACEDLYGDGADPILATSVGQLYDLSADPYETKDLWGSNPEVVETLRRKLRAIKELEPSDTFPAGPRRN